MKIVLFDGRILLSPSTHFINRPMIDIIDNKCSGHFDILPKVIYQRSDSIKLLLLLRVAFKITILYYNSMDFHNNVIIVFRN